MTVASTTNRISFAGDDATTSFDTSPVVFFNTSELLVYVVDDTTDVATTLVENTDYTVSGGAGAVGAVDTSAGSSPHGALVSDTTLVILRVLPLTQLDDYVNNDISDAEVIEDALDRIVMILQQLQEVTGRAIQFPAYDLAATTVNVASPTDRASKVLGFDANGLLVAVANVPTSGVTATAFAETLLDDTTAADMRATLDIPHIVDVSNHGNDIATAYATLPSSGGMLWLPPSNTPYTITAQLTFSDSKPVTVLGGGTNSVIKKGFNGDMISLGKRSQLVGLYLDGDGATYTGRGVVISTGSNEANSWRQIRNCQIMNTASYGVEFTAAIAGYGSSIISSRIVPTTSTVAAVKFPGGASSESSGNRTLVDVWSESNPLVDLASSNNSQIVGCQGGSPLLSQYTTKCAYSSSRIVTTADDFSVNGTANTFVGNTVNPLSMTFESNCAQVRFIGNAIASGLTIVDNAPGQAGENEIDLPYTTYTPTWAATGTAPVIGNGSLGGAAERDGVHCRVNLFLTAGSTTTFGTGYWTFTVPHTAARDTTGSVYMEDNTGITVYVGVAQILATTNVVFVATPAASAYVGAAVPFTWADLDRLRLDICFAIT